MLFLLPQPCQSEIYKYKKDGVWVFTDTPPSNMPADHKKVTESNPSSNSAAISNRLLLADYPAANAIEKATAGTVAIESALGSGSGFFISSKGHIITNKHVIRSTSKENDQTQSHFSQVQKQIGIMADSLAKEKKRIEKYKTQIDQYKKVVDAQTNSITKEAYQAKYETELTNYQQWLDDYNQRKFEFETQKKQFDSDRLGFEYARSVTNLSQSFTVILADNTRLYARVIAVSTAHDMALLKIDGYRTPALFPVMEQRVAMGDPVYAIGNPVQLKNSVTSGIFSGQENGFIKTNAQIYPGNSGGPLVTKGGRVLGINTFKRLTYKFEGLGFAIPIKRALEEFKEHLPQR